MLIIIAVVFLLEILLGIIIYNIYRVFSSKNGELVRESYFRLWLEQISGDHPGLVIAVVFGLIAFSVLSGWSLGGMKYPSWIYVKESTRQISLGVFGGKQKIDRAVDIYNELEIFGLPGYDSFDIKATTLYVTATSFRPMFQNIISENGGEIRILVLNPLMGLYSETQNEFASLAEKFGNTSEELLAESWLTVVFLKKLKQDLGRKFNIRFFDSYVVNMSEREYLIRGRSYHKYNKNNPKERFDIIVPYEQQKEEGMDSNERVAWRIRNRENSKLVKDHMKEFEDLWSKSITLQEVLNQMASRSQFEKNHE